VRNECGRRLSPRWQISCVVIGVLHAELFAGLAWWVCRFYRKDVSSLPSHSGLNGARGIDDIGRAAQCSGGYMLDLVHQRLVGASPRAGTVTGSDPIGLRPDPECAKVAGGQQASVLTLDRNAQRQCITPAARVTRLVFLGPVGADQPAGRTPMRSSRTGKIRGHSLRGLSHQLIKPSATTEGLRLALPAAVGSSVG